MAVTSAAPPPVLSGSWLDLAVRRAAGVPSWVSVLVLAALLALSWAAVYGSGGSKFTAPHLFYIPIVLATLPFGLRGALVTAFAATVLCGPMVPLVVATEEPQTTAAWLARGVMFVVIGAIAALAIGLRQRSYDSALSSDLRDAISSDLAPHYPDATLARRVDDVIAGRLLRSVFQPIYSLPDGRLVAVEALTRFDVEPYRSPDRWFAAAASIGRGVELEVLAIEAALDAVGDLPHDVQISVNASPRCLEDHRMLDVLAAHRHRRLVVEITEHDVVEDYQRLLSSVDAVRGLGVTIAVDDAGSGFASLRHVVQLAPETIKLDLSLTQDLASSPLRRALAGALVEFARATGAQLVVEGIEELADLRSWTGLGAQAAQGYLLGRPGDLPVPPLNAVIEGMHRHHPSGRRSSPVTHRKHPSPDATPRPALPSSGAARVEP